MKIENEKYSLKIGTETYPMSPREWDNVCKMICFHNRYDLGDKHDYDHRDYSGWAEMREAIIKKEKAVAILPLYLYDHSGITIATKPFSCPWDSGQVGFIVASKDSVKTHFNCNRITKKIKTDITHIIQGEVLTYDDYLTGNVYCFEIENKETGETDSCGGFFGENFWDNGMSDHITKEAINSLMPLLEKEFGKKDSEKRRLQKIIEKYIE